MVPGLNSGSKFPRSPQPKVFMRAVPRWTSEVDETAAWSYSRSRSRPSSAVSLSTGVRPRSAGQMPRSSLDSSAQTVPGSGQRSRGPAARPARPASAASVDRSAPRKESHSANHSDVQPPAPDQLLREYKAWKSGVLDWQAPPAEVQAATSKMPAHSSRCMCSRCLGYRPNGLTRLVGAAYC